MVSTEPSSKVVSSTSTLASPSTTVAVQLPLASVITVWMFPSISVITTSTPGKPSSPASWIPLLFSSLNTTPLNVPVFTGTLYPSSVVAVVSPAVTNTVSGSEPAVVSTEPSSNVVSSTSITVSPAGTVAVQSPLASVVTVCSTLFTSVITTSTPGKPSSPASWIPLLFSSLYTVPVITPSEM